MSDEIRSASLLHKELTSSLEEGERAELIEWRRTDPGAAETEASIGEAWRMAAEADPAGHWTPDVHAAWSRLQQRLEPESPSVADRTPDPQRKFLTSPLPWAAAAAVAALVGIALWWQIRPVAESVSTAEAMAENTPTVQLADGSVVHLRAGARLRYPERFETSDRTVQLEGEAFFEVAHRSDGQTFRVETRHAQVEVLGTAFNVNDRAGDLGCAVSVHRGSVRFALRSEGTTAETVLLGAGESAEYNAQMRRLTKTAGPSVNAGAWFTGELTYRDAPLARVLEDLQSEFGISATLDDRHWADCPFTGSLRRETLAENLSALARVFGGRSEEERGSGRYRLVGGSCR
jgi:transmembrane sensor